MIKSNNPFGYSVKVRIFRGDASPVMNDKAKRLNNEVYHLKREKYPIPSPPSRDYIYWIKGKPHIDLISPVKGTYIYLKPPKLDFDSINNKVNAEYDIKEGYAVIPNPENKDELIKVSVKDTRVGSEDAKAFGASMEIYDHNDKNWTSQMFDLADELHKKKEGGLKALLMTLTPFIGFFIVIIGVLMAFTEWIIPWLQTMQTGIHVTCNFTDWYNTVQQINNTAVI